MLNKKPKTLTIVGLVAVAFVAWVIWQWVVASTGPGPYDAFAQCLKEKKTVFYGAFWCPHCQNQKEMFGKSARYLPYMECSLPSGQGQTPVCEQKGIKGYPTWEFADGSRLAGEVKLQTLAERTGCPLPEET